MSTGTQDRANLCGLQPWAKWDLEKARMGFLRKDLKQVSLGDSRSSSGHQARIEGTPRSNIAPPRKLQEREGLRATFFWGRISYPSALWKTSQGFSQGATSKWRCHRYSEMMGSLTNAVKPVPVSWVQTR